MERRVQVGEAAPARREIVHSHENPRAARGISSQRVARRTKRAIDERCPCSQRSASAGRTKKRASPSEVSERRHDGPRVGEPLAAYTR